MSPEKIIVIDGSSYIFRAFFAIQNLSNSKGMPTNAVFGFVNMLMKVLDTEKPKKLVIAFDTAAPSFRKKMYAEYKANREAPPEDLIPQFAQINEVVRAFNVKQFAVEGYEADDIIGTIARRAQLEGYKVEIISGDKDLMQLVNEHVTLYDTMKDMKYDSAAVHEKFSVYPHQMTDFLALMGDSSDNIPGVTGIGKKTAADLLTEFGSLDAIYANLDKIKQNKRRESLASEKKIAFLSQELVKLDCDMPLEWDWDEFNYSGPDRKKLQEFFQEMEFQGLLKRFKMDAAPSTFELAEAKTIRTPAELKKALEALSKKKFIAFDTETTSLNPHDAQLVGVSFCADDKNSYYVPLGHVVLDGDEKVAEQGQMDLKAFIELFKPFMENPKIGKVGQNLKYDIQILWNVGIRVQGAVGDTLLASYLVEQDQPHNLDSMTFRHFGHQNIAYEDVAGKGKSQKSFSEVPINKATAYAAEDADVTFRLNGFFEPKLTEMNLRELYDDVEVPLLSVLAEMEYTGIRVNRKRLEQMSEELAHELGKEEQVIYDLAGEAFNINSPKQLSTILFEKLNLPIVKKTKTGASTDESVLTKLSKDHKICERIVSFRGLGKLKSTYVDGLLAQVHPVTKRVHSSFNQTIAATGRLSSSNPNLQNIPISGESKYDIRTVFIPEEGWELFCADYSQVELRVLADMSGDPELMRAFKNDEDVHAYTGCQIFGVDEVTPEQRRIAKTINFGVVYGQTPYGLSQTLGITNSEAKAFIDTYFERYAGVQKFMDKLKEDAKQKGYAETKLGRRRPVKEIDSKNRIRREMAERMAINTPLQGTAADMIKIAMISIHREMTKKKMKARMLVQVHDELMFEAPSEEKETLETLVRKNMESAMTLKVPLKVDAGWGANWAACKS